MNDVRKTLKINTVDDLIKAAGDFDKLKNGKKQGVVTGINHQEVFESLAKNYNIKLKSGDKSFKVDDLYVGLHQSSGTVKSSGAWTMDINKSGGNIQIRFE